MLMAKGHGWGCRVASCSNAFELEKTGVEVTGVGGVVVCKCDGVVTVRHLAGNHLFQIALNYFSKAGTQLSYQPHCLLSAQEARGLPREFAWWQQGALLLCPQRDHRIHAGGAAGGDEAGDGGDQSEQAGDDQINKWIERFDLEQNGLKRLRR